jgi:hypothetical protein
VQRCAGLLSGVAESSGSRQHVILSGVPTYLPWPSLTHPPAIKISQLMLATHFQQPNLETEFSSGCKCQHPSI